MKFTRIEDKAFAPNENTVGIPSYLDWLAFVKLDPDKLTMSCSDCRLSTSLFDYSDVADSTRYIWKKAKFVVTLSLTPLNAGLRGALLEQIRINLKLTLDNQIYR